MSLRESFAGRPPLRPRARAALRPATVLSLIRLRSNSASAAKTWKTRRPAGEPVSIFSVSDFEIDLSVFQVGDESDEIGEVAAQPIESPNNEGVAFTQAL